MAIPSEADIRKIFPSESEVPSSALVFVYYQCLKDGTVEQLTPSDNARPLSELFHLLLSYLMEALKDAWGGTTRDQVMDRMKKMAARLSGGIELG